MEKEKWSNYKTEEEGVTRESKNQADQEFRRQLSERQEESKKLLWKEMKRLKGCMIGDCRGIKD